MFNDLQFAVVSISALSKAVFLNINNYPLNITLDILAHLSHLLTIFLQLIFVDYSHLQTTILLFV